MGLTFGADGIHYSENNELSVVLTIEDRIQK